MRGRFSILLLGLVMLFVIIIQLMTSQSTTQAQPPFLTNEPGGPPFLTPGGPPVGPPIGTPATAVFTPVPATLTPTATSPAPGCNSALVIPIGSDVTIYPGVNIRAAPSVSSAIVGNFPENRIFKVVNGPICGDDYVWWQIDGNEISNGWVAERNINVDFIRSFVPPTLTGIPCAVPLSYEVGQLIELSTGLRVRNAPSLQGRVITVAPAGAVALVLNTEQVCSDGYNWVNVAVTVANFTYEGWLVEGGTVEIGDIYIEGTTTLEGTTCRTPRTIATGTQGRVRYTDNLPKNLRAEPSFEGEVIFTLVRGVPLEVIGGPVCADNMNWWLVRILSRIEAIGWLAEGPAPNYWFTVSNDVGAEFVLSITPTPTPEGDIITPTGTFNPAPTATETSTFVPIPSFTPSATTTAVTATWTPLPTFVPTATFRPPPTVDGGFATFTPVTPTPLPTFVPTLPVSPLPTFAPTITPIAVGRPDSP